MEEQIKKASLEAFPVVLNVTGGDCNKSNREQYEDGIIKGIEIANSQSLLRNIVIKGSYIHVDEVYDKIVITNNEELKDFEVWKAWRNKD